MRSAAWSHARAWTAACAVVMLSVSATACKSTPEEKPSPTPVGQGEPVDTYTPDEVAITTPPENIGRPGEALEILSESAFSEEERSALLIALGCSQYDVTEKGCKVCPTVDPSEPMSPPVPTGPDREVVLDRGNYIDGFTEQVVATVDDCVDADGNANVSQLALLVRNGSSEPWRVTSAFALRDAARCESLETLSGSTRTLCITQRDEAQGLVKRRHGVTWLAAPAGVAEGGLPDPHMKTLLETVEGSGCAQNWSLEHKVKQKVEDVDGDGAAELVFDVATKEGAYVGPLDECLDGAFEEPLKPAREARQFETRVIYHPSPDGFEPVGESAAQIPISEEYRALLLKSKATRK